MNSDYFWSPDQIKILEACYKTPDGGGLKAATNLLQKNKGAIAVQASRLKLTKPRPRKEKEK